MLEHLSTDSLFGSDLDGLEFWPDCGQLSRPFIKGQGRQRRRMYLFFVRSVEFIAWLL